jgi:KDO2-lipid IV(A) lauroyltransferase
MFARSDGIQPVIRAMRDGLPFFMCPDMDFGAKDAKFVPFFGVPAATLTAPARLAAVTGAKVIPVVATVLPNYKGWKITFFPPWEDYPGKDLVQATRRMNQFIEEQILKTPAEYFWVHRRFKTRPPGEPDLYETV